MDDRERLSILESNLDRQLQWIAAADSKVAFAFTLVTAMLGFLAALAPTDVAAWTLAPAISAAFSAAGGSASLGFLCAAAFPRTEGPRSSLVYFAGIARRNLEQFKTEVSGLTSASHAADVAAQCHRNAEIAEAKFRWVQRAMIALYLSVFPWVVSVWLLYSSSKTA